MRSTIRGWLRLGGAGLLVSVLLACGPGATSPGPSGGVPSASPAASDGQSALDTLTAALAPLAVAAEFESAVTVDGAVVVTMTGRSVGAATQVSVVRDGRTVEYVQVPPSAWARDTAGKWILVTADEAPANPIGVLAAPTSAEFADGSAARPVSITASYPAAALGLTGETVSVAITIDGVAVTFRYETTIDGHSAATQTTLRPATTIDPIVPPIP